MDDYGKPTHSLGIHPGHIRERAAGRAGVDAMPRPKPGEDLVGPSKEPAPERSPLHEEES